MFIIILIVTVFIDKTLTVSINSHILNTKLNKTIILNEENYKDAYPKCIFMCQQCNEKEMICRNMNMNNYDLIRNAIASTEIVIFTGNTLNQLDRSIFSEEKNFMRLLDLSNNKIVSINGSDVFRHLPNLVELNLDYNTISLNSQDEFKALAPLSSSLKRLSLNSAFRGSKSASYNQSIIIDRQIHSLLRLSSLYNLEELRISGNSLISFNVEIDDDEEDETDNSDLVRIDEDIYGPYDDILCILPNLKQLYLDSNLLNRFDFEMNCLKDKNNINLEILDMRSNKINTIQQDLIDKLENFKKLNPKFHVFLSNNPFKCDCSLYRFYSWIKFNEDNYIVRDTNDLVCTHDESYHITLYKKVVDSRLERFCSSSTLPPMNTQPFETRSKIIYFPTRNRTRITTPAPSKHSRRSFNNLIVFIICVLIISAVVLLIFKLHCKRVIQRKRFNIYKTLDDGNVSLNGDMFNGTTVNGVHVPNIYDDSFSKTKVINYEDQNEHIEFPEDKQNGPKRILSKVTQTYKDKKSAIVSQFNKNKSNLSEDSAINYDRFDEPNPNRDSKSSRNIFKDSSRISLTKTILNKNPKTLQGTEISFSDEDEDYDYAKEEETVIDTVSINSSSKIIQDGKKPNKK